MLRDCKRKHTNLAMAWIDCKKAYGMVHHIGISECLEMFGTANNVQDFLNNSMKSWNLELNVSGEKLREVDIRRGIFQGRSLSLSPLFVLCMIPLTWLSRRTKTGHEWGNKVFKLNHFLFMDGLKLFAKSKNQIDSLVHTVHIFSEHIGMQFGIKCGVLIMERGKNVRADATRLPDGQDMKDIDETG